MIELTDEMRRLINRARTDGAPCIMATSSPDGVPNAGFRGTMMVLDENSLAYRERAVVSGSFNSVAISVIDSILAQT